MKKQSICFSLKYITILAQISFGNRLILELNEKKKESNNRYKEFALFFFLRISIELTTFSTQNISSSWTVLTGTMELFLSSARILYHFVKIILLNFNQFFFPTFESCSNRTPDQIASLFRLFKLKHLCSSISFLFNFSSSTFSRFIFVFI